MILTVKIEKRPTGPSGTSPSPPPGVGYIVHTEDLGDKLFVRCPRCLNVAVCPHDLTIVDNKPTLSPSFVCPRCGFHSNLKDGIHQQLTDKKVKK